jgi:hypothetical protein
MEKGLAWLLALVSLVSLSFEIFFVKIDCEQLSDLWSQNSWSQSVWGTKDSWKGPYDIKAMVVISLSHLI